MNTSFNLVKQSPECTWQHSEIHGFMLLVMQSVSISDSIGHVQLPYNISSVITSHVAEILYQPCRQNRICLKFLSQCQHHIETGFFKSATAETSFKRFSVLQTLVNIVIIPDSNGTNANSSWCKITSCITLSPGRGPQPSIPILLIVSTAGPINRAGMLWEWGMRFQGTWSFQIILMGKIRQRCGLICHI